MALPAAAVAQSADPLAPSSKWNVDYADAACFLLRDFGEGQARLSFSIRSLPLAGGKELALFLPDPNKRPLHMGQAVITLSPEGKTIRSQYLSYGAVEPGRRVVRFHADAEAWKDFASSETVAIALDTQAPIALRLDGLGAALKAVRLCEIDLVKSWGLGPEVMDLSPQFVDPKWIKHEDYPIQAIHLRLRGTVTIL